MLNLRLPGPDVRDRLTPGKRRSQSIGHALDRLLVERVVKQLVVQADARQQVAGTDIRDGGVVLMQTAEQDVIR